MGAMIHFSNMIALTPCSRADSKVCISWWSFGMEPGWERRACQQDLMVAFGHTHITVTYILVCYDKLSHTPKLAQLKRPLFKTKSTMMCGGWSGDAYKDVGMRFVHRYRWMDPLPPHYHHLWIFDCCRSEWYDMDERVLLDTYRIYLRRSQRGTA